MISVLTLLLTLGIKGAVIWILWQEYRWGYGTRQWRQGWGVLLLATTYLAVRYLVYFLTPDADFWTVEREIWTPIHAAFLLLGYWRLSTVFHHELPVITAPMASIVINEHSVIVEWGENAAALFGWTAAEVVGKTLMETIMPSRYWEAHREAVTTFLTSEAALRPGVRILTTTARHKNGQDTPVEITVSAHQVNGQWQFHGVIRRLVVL